MTAHPASEVGVIGGIDTHLDTIHVAAIDAIGRDIDDREFPTTPAGYRDALSFLTDLGEVTCIGIEGTSSYGAGITTAARTAGHDVREVIRPHRTVRRMKGKSDPIDAYQAARSVLAGQAPTRPKTEHIEALRALVITRRSAVKARTAAMNQIRGMLVTAPVELRQRYRAMSSIELIKALCTCRPGNRADTHRAILTALKLLAQRHDFLAQQINAVEGDMRDLVAQSNLSLISAHGVGTHTAAQLLITAGGNPQRLASEASFAALCGTAPVPASSGKTNRYRLSRGGDRQANCALHTIVLVRMSSDARTKAFVAAQRAKGRATADIMRILQRAIAREIYKHLLRPNATADIHDLRASRTAKNIPLIKASTALGTTQIHISRIERGLTYDKAFTDRYRRWLQVA